MVPIFLFVASLLWTNFDWSNERKFSPIVSNECFQCSQRSDLKVFFTIILFNNVFDETYVVVSETEHEVVYDRDSILVDRMINNIDEALFVQKVRIELSTVIVVPLFVSYIA